ncbi:MAG: hypothetical protein OEV66_03280 [Spirochaetia bacterium]|nr:hypothetical protein [Spirochaetia bacterium]
MEISLGKKWLQYRVQKKINSISRKIFYELSKVYDEPLEFGNLRRSSEWGILKDGNVYWIILLDIVQGRPIQYMITYSLSDKKFSCFAATSKNNFSSIFQFSTTDIKELEYRLRELANHIPSLRERILREFIYNESRKYPRRRWYKLFIGKDKIREYLNNIIDNLYNQKKITSNEMIRLQTYVENLA